VTAPGAGSWLVCERTLRALARLEDVLRVELRAEDLQLRVIALELVERGGKRIRPALLLLAASFGARSVAQANLLRAAAALEMVHVASLYHDDVIDRAPLRRQAASVNSRWGNTLAGIGGTFLFARASNLFARLGDAANRLAGEAFIELCGGQLREMQYAYDLDLDEEEHLEILARKTATLFALPCRLGAELVGLPQPAADALTCYGHHLGVAFQLADDALDIAGRPETMGKAVGTDLRQGIYSLAVLRAVRNGSEAGLRIRSLLQRLRADEHDVVEVLALLRASGAAEHALQLAARTADRACSALESLPDSPARTSLRNLARHAVARSS
jgi:geranylgeranyl pyrophosphate synthase